MPPQSNNGPSLIPGQQAIFSPSMHPPQAFYQLLHLSFPACPTVIRCNQQINASLTNGISHLQLEQPTSFPAWRHTPSSLLTQPATPDARLILPTSTASLYTLASQLCVATSVLAPACVCCPSPKLLTTKQQAQLLLPIQLPYLLPHPPPPSMLTTFTNVCVSCHQQHSSWHSIVVKSSPPSLASLHD
jgi:hypothetical protein